MKKFCVVVMCLMLGACAGSQVNQATLVHDLAWDVGYLGYTFSPENQAKLDAGCDLISAFTDNSSNQVEIFRNVLSQVWVDANSPSGIALILVINNLVGSLGLDNSIVVSEPVKSAMTAMCVGVAQAKKGIK